MVWDGELDVRESVWPLCEDCLGTSIAHDFDASMTGIADAPYVCACVPRPPTAHPASLI
ncbi:MAG: hypothetical protein ACRDRH_03950 [Pseudonocardia sp.]